VKSCIYAGLVRHTRQTPVLHRFRYRVFMTYLDLGELDTVFRGRWLWSTSRIAIARFKRSNHLGPVDQPLDESVRDLVEAETGTRPAGPVRLLTNLSFFGYCFNPVSFYYCFAEDGETVEAIVNEVTNTPWGERTTYVLSAHSGKRQGKSLRFGDAKKMHVSPFMPMDIEYDWCFADPADRLSVFMANAREGKPFFDASIVLNRREINGKTLAQVLVSYPFITLKIMAAIHWQALRLWVKRCPLYTHPDKRGETAIDSR